MGLMAELTIRAGHPDFLDLDWDVSIRQWQSERLLDLPKGISRHEVLFLQYPQGIYAVKELSERAAHQDYQVLRSLEGSGTSAVRAVGLVEGRHPDPFAEEAAALITEYEPFSFSYRELLAGPGFGARRNQMINAFAELLVELHLAGVFWGDCSLSNVLYRFDAETIETIMVDGETAEVFESGTLSDGRRTEDIEIMIINVAGGMADIAAEAGVDIDEADLELGEAIADVYRSLWTELTVRPIIHADERYKIAEHVGRLNHLGFDVSEIDLIPVDAGGSLLKVRLHLGGRTYHTNRLKDLTGVDALENQARQILSDLHYYQAETSADTPTGKNIAAIRWRVEKFEPVLSRLRKLEGVVDPIQAYCDLLHHRYVMSRGAGRDVGTEAALSDWIARGRPGYPLEPAAG
jgi:hypothetical protein